MECVTTLLEYRASPTNVTACVTSSLRRKFVAAVRTAFLYEEYEFASTDCGKLSEPSRAILAVIVLAASSVSLLLCVIPRRYSRILIVALDGMPFSNDVPISCACSIIIALLTEVDCRAFLFCFLVRIKCFRMLVACSGDAPKPFITSPSADIARPRVICGCCTEIAVP